jgi:hypothetical protein
MASCRLGAGRGFWGIPLIAVFLVGTAQAQSNEEEFGQAVRRSLERSRALYPELSEPGSPLSEAVLVRVDWISRNKPGYFSDPNWPEMVASAEAARLGIRARTGPAAPAEPSGRYLAVVTKNFSVTGASFRKGQQIVLESLQDDNKRGITLVDGAPILFWLDYVKLLRPIPRGESAPAVVKILAARYGPPDAKGTSVAGAVQTLMVASPEGPPELFVSDALVPPAALQRMNRAATTRTVVDPATGEVKTFLPRKVLTVTYEVNGREKTRQALEGETVVFE